MYDVIIGPIVQEQHGFVRGRSTLTNLLIYNEFIINTFADCMQVDLVYNICDIMDFSKAFGSVQYSLLVAKLSNLSVRGIFLKWIQSYLSGRKQIVRLNGALSKPTSVTTGIPQGSHLGPMLFIIFINDIQG